MASVLAPPVQVVEANAPPFVHVASGAPPFVAVSGNAPPIMIVESGAPPITLFNEDGSLWAGGAPAAVGGAALLTGETDGFATDFTYATDANRVCKKVASVNTEYALDSFYIQSGTSPKMVYDVAGVLGWSPHNLLARSSEFDNAVAWSVSGSTISANASAAPDGTLTADKIQEDGNNSFHYVYQAAIVADGAYTFSIYFKAAERTWAYLRFTTGPNAVFFNLGSGTLGTVDAGYTATITTAGNGWYRCSVTTTAAAGTYYAVVGPANGDNVGTYTGTVESGVYAWGAQLNRGSTALAYLPTTTTARIGCALDYDPVTHAAKGLLVEPQATNLLLTSNTFTNGWEGPSGLTQAQNATGPLGANTATTLTMTAGSSGKALYHPIANGNYRYSIYGKAGTLSWLSLADGSQPLTHGAFFNLTTGTIGTVAGHFSTATMEPVGNGWYRCSVTVTGSVGYFGAHAHTADNQVTYWTAVGGETILVSAAQCETGTVATSYIPTTSATVTRAADAVTCLTSTFPWSAAGSNSIISNAAGKDVATAIYWSLHDGTDAERYLLDTSSGTKKARLFTADANVTQTDLFGAVGAPVAGTYYKVGVAMATNDFAGSIDGGTVATDTVATLPTVTTLQLGGSRTSTGRNVYLKTIKIVPRRMTNGQLQTETAP